MRLSWSSGLQADLKAPSVGQFLNVPAEIIDKDDGMASRQSIPPGRDAGSGCSTRKLLGENVDRHCFQYRVV